MGKKGKTKELSSPICRQCTTAWSWCVRNASAVPSSHLRPSSTMARRAASHPWKKAPMNHLCQPNCKHKVCPINISKMGTWTEDWMEDLTSAKPTHWDTPALLTWTWTEDQISIKPMHTYHLNLLASHSDSSNGRMSPSQTGPFMLHMMGQLLSSKNSMQTHVPYSWYQIHLPYWLPLQSEP